MDRFALCKDEEGNIQQSGDHNNPGILVFDVLANSLIVVAVEDLPKYGLQGMPDSLDNKEDTLLQCMSSSPLQSSSSDLQANQGDDGVLVTSEPSCSWDIQRNEIWLKNCGRPTATDHRATDTLINLVGNDKYKSLLKDKKTNKKRVWSDIGKELMAILGITFGNRDPGTVCHQKWRNLECKTTSFIQNGGPKNTGAGKSREPTFYKEVADIIKDSPNATPKNLMDSMGEASPSSQGSSNSMDKENTSPFCKVGKTTRPLKRKHNEILDFLKNDAELRNEQFQSMQSLLREKLLKDAERGDKMLSILEKLTEK